jgi:hypothetical protein
MPTINKPLKTIETLWSIEDYMFKSVQNISCDEILMQLTSGIIKQWDPFFILPLYLNQSIEKNLINKLLYLNIGNLNNRNFKVIKTLGDGNCLYNAVSIVLFGN